LRQVRAIHDAIGRKQDMSLAQAICLFALGLDFQPSVILDLGRAHGNSTAVFTAVANQVARCEVLSFCQTDIWQRETASRVGQPPEWFAPLRLYTGDLTSVDFAPLLHERDRVIVFLDAHGFSVIEHVLAHILPLIAGRTHLVVCHDISDNRFCGEQERSYDGRRFWRGMDDWYRNRGCTAYTNLGWVRSVVDQVIAILDFCSRNRLELHSADFAFADASARHPEWLDRVRQSLPEVIGQSLDFAWFSLNEGAPPFHFPVATGSLGEAETERLKAESWATRAALEAEVESLRAELVSIQTSRAWKFAEKLRGLKRAFILTRHW
jgi:hypothetical protein